MRDDEYKLRTGVFLESDEYRSLSPLQRLFVRELLDCLWASSEKSESREDPGVLCTSWGWAESDVDALLSQGLPTLDGVVRVAMDLTTFDDVLVSPLLEAQKLEYQEWYRHQIKMITERKVKEARTTATGRAKAKKSDPRIIYLSPSERQSEAYSGWLPTLRFDSQGQAYNITNEILEGFSSEFPEKNLNSEMSAIYEWLMRNPQRRKPLAGMNDFIHRWLSADWNKTTSDDGIATAIDDVFAALAAEG